MATGVWGKAQQLLREAADIIKQRSAGRDETGRPDTIALAALAEGLTEQQVLAAMVGVKRARMSRGHDHDSAIDLLAYEARRLVSLLPSPVVTAVVASVQAHFAEAEAGQAMAAAQFETACSGPELNHAGGSIAE